MLKCPVCQRRMVVNTRYLSCPWCGAKLRFPRPTRIEYGLVGVISIFASVALASYLVSGITVLFVVAAICLPLTASIAWVAGIILGTLFPRKLRRDEGWPDEGTMLHITPPPDPPEDSSQ